jgi:hypothetical protein
MHNFIFLVLRARQIISWCNKEKEFNCDPFRCHSEVQIINDILLPSLRGGQYVALLNPLSAELNPIRHLLALVGVRHIVHVSRIRGKRNHVLVVTEEE